MIKKITNHLSEQKIYRDVVVTGIVGAVAATIDIAILNILHQLVHINIYVATFFGFLAGSIFGYPANNYWTYRRYSQKAHLGGLLKSVTVATVGLMLTEVIMYSFNGRLGYHYNLVKLIAIFVVFFWNFFGNRYWTFRATTE